MAILLALALTPALGACQPNAAGQHQGGGGPQVHTGDVCQWLGRERLDAQGTAVRCLRGPGEPAATWKRRPW